MNNYSKINRPTYNIFAIWIVVCFVLTFFYTPAFSATITSAVKGIVKDKVSGNSIEKVKIVITSLRNATLVYTVYTDEKGFYYKAGLDNGMFRVSVEKDDYVPLQTTFRLGVADLLEFNVELEAMKKKAAASSFDLVIEAKSLLDAGKFDQAIAKISEAIVKDPDIFILYFNRAVAYEKKADKEKAIADYQKSLELKPDFVLSLSALGRIYAKEGKNEKAVSFYKAAFDNGITDIIALYNYGACLINIGNSNDAKVVFEKLISIDPNYADAYYHLGIIYLGLNDNPKSRECLQKFLELDPQNENASVAKEILKTL